MLYKDEQLVVPHTSAWNVPDCGPGNWWLIGYFSIKGHPQCSCWAYQPINTSIITTFKCQRYAAKALHCVNMCHMCVNETFNSYMILNNLIGSIHHYHNILFVIVCLLCIHNVVGVKHDVSSVLYQHYNMKWWYILCMGWKCAVLLTILFSVSLRFGPLRKTLGTF